MSVGKDGTLGGDQEIAVQGQLETAGDRRPVHSADQRLGHRNPRRSCWDAPVLGQKLGAGTQFFQIETGAKGRIGSGEDDGADLFVGSDFHHRLAQTAEERQAQSVAGGGSVQGDSGDAAGALQ